MTVFIPSPLSFNSNRRHNIFARFPKIRSAIQSRMGATNRGMVLGLAALLFVFTGCTAGRLEGASQGWSPAAVSSQTQSSRTVISEG